MDGKMDLSIVIPMFNEAENAETSLNRVEEALASFDGTYEIIVVNDGSIDHTLEILRKIQSQKENVRVVCY
jgi:glycosyltransferase involved in cell wall biosynthesis